MPSTLVHMALAGLLAAALLADDFSPRTVGIIFVMTAALDLDTFIGVVVPGTHRAALHNLWVPLLLLGILGWDRWGRDRSLLQSVGLSRTAWVGLAAIVFAHLFVDAFYNGVNLFWPIHDQFYDFSGKLIYSDQRGFVQTFIEFEVTDQGTTVGGETTRGTTANTHYRTGIDPSRGADPDAERIFWLINNGELFAITVMSYAVVGYRILVDQIR